MKDHTCCFTGHRSILPRHLSVIASETEEKIRRLYRRGYRDFCAGGALGFDTIAARAVLKCKKDCPGMRLILILPCPQQTRGWKAEDVAVYENIKKAADEVIYTSDCYYTGCMHARNRRLVEESSCCIAYVQEKRGGTAYTVEYCERQGIPVYRVCDAQRDLLSYLEEIEQF